MPKKSDNGLVLYMPFDENRTDNVTYDYALNNNGSLGNVTSGTQPMWNASGRISGAFIFDGNDDIAVNSSGSLNITTNITLSCWVKLKSYIQLSSTANWHSSCIYKTGGPLGSNVIGYGLLIANNTGAVGLAIDTN
ncbi:hypothetical protein HYT26_01890, partial [Candidatus Pacearchaeota archaeon]|nr:hypothetical protein [Candidatus Pacearchaeota archaeon]